MARGGIRGFIRAVPRSTTHRFLIATALAAVCFGFCRSAAAATTHHSPYTYSQCFGSTLRLLKVDLNVPVVDPNAEWGYLLFEYTTLESGTRKNRGAFEFVRRDGQVRVTLKLPQLPSYHERVMLKQLQRKLADEHGPPPPRQPKTKSPSETDRDKQTEKDNASPPAKR